MIAGVLNFLPGVPQGLLAPLAALAPEAPLVLLAPRLPVRLAGQAAH